MNLGIEGKVALVTGSGRGLGRSIAESLSREGVRLILTARTEEDLSLLAKTLPSEVVYCPADLSTQKGYLTLVDFIQKQNLQPDILIHNVGGNLNVTNPLCSIEEWREVMRINVELPLEFNKLYVPGMQKKKWGRICHVSSIAGLENQGPPSYCAAKAALIAYARSLGRYLAKDGIVVTSILPGAVYTEGGYWEEASKSRPDHVQKYLAERMAIQRFGKPEEISEIVTFLCSNHSSFCIGSAVLADGGQGRVFFNQEGL